MKRMTKEEAKKWLKSHLMDIVEDANQPIEVSKEAAKLVVYLVAGDETKAFPVLKLKPSPGWWDWPTLSTRAGMRGGKTRRRS